MRRWLPPGWRVRRRRCACCSGRYCRGDEGADDRLAPGALALAGVMARVCGWRPGEFWAATPAEVAAVLAGWRGDDDGGGGIDGAALAAMMEQYPDG